MCVYKEINTPKLLYLYLYVSVCLYVRYITDFTTSAGLRQNISSGPSFGCAGCSGHLCQGLIFKTCFNKTLGSLPSHGYADSPSEKSIYAIQGLFRNASAWCLACWSQALQTKSSDMQFCVSLLTPPPPPCPPRSQKTPEKVKKWRLTPGSWPARHQLH